MKQYGRVDSCSRASSRRRGRARAGPFLVALVFLGSVSGCAQGSSTHAGSTPSASTRQVLPQGPGHLVVADNRSQTGASYIAFNPNGGQGSWLKIPAYSPAGFNRLFTRVAVFESGGLAGDSVTDPSTLSVSALDHSGSKVIATFKGDDATSDPAWNPAGSEIAISLTVSTDRGVNQNPQALSAGLWVVNVNTHHSRQLVAGSVGRVTWSPDGRTLAYVAFPTTGTSASIKTVPFAGGQPTLVAELPNEAVHPGTPYGTTLSWSPDGKAILVCYILEKNYQLAGTGVSTYPSTGGPATVILPVSINAAYVGATYSPDGSRIAVAVLHPDPSSAATANSPARTGTANSPTTPAGTPPQPIVEQLQLMGPNGAKPHDAAVLSYPARLVGW